MDKLNGENFSNRYSRIKKQVIQPKKPTIVDDQNLWAIFDELELLREQIDYWRSVEDRKNQELEKLQQQLRDAYEELQALYQELMYTNQALAEAVRFQNTSLAEVKQLAKAILATEKPAAECLAELISVLYGFPVTLDILESNGQLTHQTKPSIISNSNALITQSRKLKKL